MSEIKSVEVVRAIKSQESALDETRQILAENLKANGGSRLRVPLVSPRMRILMEAVKAQFPQMKG